MYKKMSMLIYVGVFGTLFASELLRFHFNGEANVVGCSFCDRPMLRLKLRKVCFSIPHPGDFANQNWQICWVILPEIHVVIVFPRTPPKTADQPILSNSYSWSFSAFPAAVARGEILADQGVKHLLVSHNIFHKSLRSVDGVIASDSKFWGRWSTISSTINKYVFFLGVPYAVHVQVEQEIWDLCFRTINDPVELGLTGGGGPWARWMQLGRGKMFSFQLAIISWVDLSGKRWNDMK